MDISNMTTIELEALAYRQLQERDRIINNLALITSRLAELQQQEELTNKTPKEKTKAT